MFHVSCRLHRMLHVGSTARQIRQKFWSRDKLYCFAEYCTNLLIHENISCNPCNSPWTATVLRFKDTRSQCHCVEESASPVSYSSSPSLSAIIIKILLNHRAAYWNIHKALLLLLCFRLFVHGAKSLPHWQSECSNPDCVCNSQL